LPAALDDRAPDNWALLAVADTAGDACRNLAQGCFDPCPVALLSVTDVCCAGQSVLIGKPILVQTGVPTKRLLLDQKGCPAGICALPSQKEGRMNR
jgi:hypothetical protein